MHVTMNGAFPVVALATVLAIGCSRQERLEDEARQRELRDAQSAFYKKQLTHRRLDQKVPLIAIKYGVPEQVVRDFVDTYEVEDFSQTFLRLMSATNAIQFRELEARIDSLPPISKRVEELAKSHGVDPKVLASALIEFHIWQAAEGVTDNNRTAFGPE